MGNKLYHPLFVLALSLGMVAAGSLLPDSFYLVSPAAKRLAHETVSMVVISGILLVALEGRRLGLRILKQW